MANNQRDSLLQLLKKTIQQDTNRVNILNELCKTYRTQKHDSAEYFGGQALQLSRQLNYNRGEVIALNFLGSNFFYEGNYQKADSLQTLCISLCQKYNLKKNLAIAYNSLGLSKQYQDDYISSLDNYLKALDIEEVNNNIVGKVKVMANLSSVYAALGDEESSLNYVTKAYQLNQGLPEKFKLKGALATKLGNYYADRSEFYKALPYFLKALEENKKTGIDFNIALSLSNVGYCYLNLNRPNEASRYVEEANQLSTKINALSIKALNLINKGDLALHQNNIQKALSLINQGLTMAVKLKEKRTELIGYKSLANVFARIGNTKTLNLYWDKAYSLNDSLHKKEISSTVSNIQKSYEVAKKQTELDQSSKELKIKSLEIEKERNLKYLFFFGFTFLILFSSLIGYQVYTKNKLNQKLVEQNKIIEAVNRTLGETASRAQMNPHFIFNCLNSIQYLIINENNEEANKYLISFSTLLRNILEFSTKQMITLREEIQMLDIYLRLEALRMDENFNYEIDLNDIDTEKYFIPPMIIQPFLENAIAHGLMHKPANRLLKIRFSSTATSLICKVIDNGIGRDKARSIAQNKTGKTSKGIEITRNRLVIFNQSADDPIIFEDLFDENQKSIGTSVAIKFSISS